MAKNKSQRADDASEISTKKANTLSSDAQDSRYIIDIPSFWSKEDLLDLRDYLEKTEIGLIPVWIRIHGLEKDTKFSIADRLGLEQWLERKGG